MLGRQQSAAGGGGGGVYFLLKFATPNQTKKLGKFFPQKKTHLIFKNQ